MIYCENLRTERLRTPHGVVVDKPAFTWTLGSDINEERQSACEVEVERLAVDGSRSLVWSSGKLKKPIGEDVHYEGEKLESRSDYCWRVRVWPALRETEGVGADQVGEWSCWADFETGVVAPDEIGAQWIAGGGALRRELSIGEGLLRARAYVSGLGYYEFFCNGQKVSAAALAPSFTEFDKRVEYEIIDLTAHLKSGSNCLGFLLADGWWKHSQDFCEQKADGHQDRTNQGLGEIVLEYADGRREVVSTDESWQAETGPIILEDNRSSQQFFDGITLDLGWLASNWCFAGTVSTDWQSATTSCEQVSTLVPSLLPPVREVEVLKPLFVKELSDKVLVIDFGQNFTGWIRFRASANKGTRLVVQHAELLRKDGRLNPASLRSAQQLDTFVLSGNPKELVEPRLLHHGLRYAEIQGSIEAVDIDSIEGVVIHTDLESVSTITTSDARINWLLDALRWTIRSNAMSIMTDVCQRDERRGWLMDGFTALKAGLLFYDMDTMARKWVEDMIDNQEADGSLYSGTAPKWGKYKSVGWQRAIILTPMIIYENSGDRDLLQRAYPHMRGYADYLLANLKDDLLPAGFSEHPVEWLCIGNQNDELGDNAVAIDALRKLARAAEVLGEAHGEAYTKAADKMAAAAGKRWKAGICWHGQPGGHFGGDGGQNYAQSNQVYGLRFGLVAPEDRQDVFDSLVVDIMQARGDEPFVTTGIGSTEHLPFVLSEFGREDIVWQWLQRDTYPGYGFMQHHGATAIWECWDQRLDEGMNAHNHTGLTGIGVWLREYLIGFNVEPGPEPLFHLRPALHLPLDSLNAKWMSRWGEIEVSWTTREGHKELNITIPIGCRGHLQLLPGGEELELGSGKHENLRTT